MGYLDWQSFTIKRLLLRDSFTVMQALHAAAARTFDRALLAAQAHFPESAAADALPILAADASLPTYVGESPAQIRARLAQRNALLGETGTLRAMTRILQMYLPGSARVGAFTRQGRYDIRAGMARSFGTVAGFDWDSAAYPTGLPAERQNDVFLFAEGPFDFTFSTAVILQPGEKVYRPGESVGLLGATASAVWPALRVALAAHSQFITQIPILVLADPLLPSGTYFDPGVPASLPAGQFGRASTRPAEHRYIGITQ